MRKPGGIVIVAGGPGDYGTLARFHYRGAAPAVCVRTLSAVDQLTGELVGVLTVSMPTLNGPWRGVAWPRLFPGAARRTAGHQRATAASINRHVRTISRVVVDPRYRALGIARRLVAAYLADPDTTCTEALASMGRWCPFFAKAGMREVRLPPSRRERAFARALERLGLEAWELADIERAGSAVRASRVFRAAVRTWAAYSRATRHHVPEPDDFEAWAPLAVLAGASLTARPSIYVS